MGRDGHDRAHGQIHERVMTVCFHAQPKVSRNFARGHCMVEGGGQDVTQSVARHLEDVADAGLARTWLQIHSRAAMQVQDVAPLIDERSGWCHLL